MKAVELHVDGYSERWLRKGFPWVYQKEVVVGKASPGTEVILRTKGGDVLGRGIADEGWLAARVYRHRDGPLDVAWLRGVLENALSHRRRAIASDTNAYRLVHAENDGLPGIRIDIWATTAVIALDSPAVAVFLDPIADWLKERLDCERVYLCYRPDPRDSIDRGRLRPAPGLLRGEPVGGAIAVKERGLTFLVYPNEGPDVGLYGDMREVRAWLEPHFRGRRVLNTFAFTGAFSVVAAARGAEVVVSVDLSERAIARARENYAANNLPIVDDAFVVDDTFRALDRFRRTETTFDMIILDPPIFSHSPAGTWSAIKDYPRLVSSAVRVIEPGGWLVVASNLGELSPHRFTGEIEDGLKRAGRKGQEIWRGGQAPDFPAASWFPEGRYLKVAVVRVI